MDINAAENSISKKQSRVIIFVSCVGRCVSDRMEIFMNIKETVMHRVERNPILTPSSFPKGYAMMECGQTKYGNKYLLLVPIQRTDKISPAIYVAESTDGEHFDIRLEPLIIPSKKYKDVDKYVSHPSVSYVPEDDAYYITRPLSKNSWGKAQLLSKTMDFKTVEEMGIIALPHNTVSCIFQGKVKGRYARLDRPDSDSFKPSLWISFSDDLKYWGEYTPLLKPYTNWNADRICPTPPIKTKDGWLVIYHGVKEGRCSIGAFLLDIDDPTKIVAKGKSPILTPNVDFEYKGYTQKATVDTCGAIVDEETDEIRIYYCGAGMSIGMAKGKLSELLELIKHEDANFEDWQWS